MMLKIDKTVLPSPQQWGIIIEGMRNPMNSWDKSDSTIECGEMKIGGADKNLMRKLCGAGRDHRKFMRMIPVWVTITAPIYWWKQFDTYKIGTVASSCSTMHKIHNKPITVDDFSIDNVDLGDITLLDCFINVVADCETLRQKYTTAVKAGDTAAWDYWRGLIQLLPSSYNQMRTQLLNYEVLRNIYRSRKNHKLDEWHTFCDWIETLPYSELITGSGNDEQS